MEKSILEIYRTSIELQDSSSRFSSLFKKGDNLFALSSERELPAINIVTQESEDTSPKAVQEDRTLDLNVKDVKPSSLVRIDNQELDTRVVRSEIVSPSKSIHLPPLHQKSPSVTKFTPRGGRSNASRTTENENIYAKVS